MIQSGTYPMYMTSADREAGTGVPLTFDFTHRHEIAEGLATMGAYTCRIMLDDVEVVDLTIVSTSVDASGKYVTANVANTAGVPDNTYHLVFNGTLTNGTPIIEAILIPVYDI